MMNFRSFYKARATLFKCLSFVLVVLLIAAQISAGFAGEHPELILTPERIAALKSSAKTTHSQLWKLALQSADEFAERTIPELKDAHNRFRPLGDTIPVLGLAYWMTGEERYVKAAEKWLSALLSVPEWKGSENLGRSSWTVGCALLYDWLYYQLHDEMRERIKKRLISEAPIIRETAARTRALSNHLLIETTALGMIGLALQPECEEAEDFLRQADEWTKYIIEYAPRDGSWGEGVQYWQYGLGYFVRYLEACKTSGHRDYFDEYDWVSKTGFFPIYFSVPARPSEVINFSDCGSKRYLPPFLLYFLASHYNNGYYQDFGKRLETRKPHKLSWLDFIFYDPSVKLKDIHTLPTLKHFSDNDFVTMRSGWDEHATTVGFRCGPAPGHRNQQHPLRLKNRGFGPGHGHPDINSFNIFSKGEWLAIDPGYTKLKQTRNHNTIMVNGFGQAGAGKMWLDYMAFEACKPTPAILRVESNSVYDYVIGDAGNIYVDEANLKHFRRHLLFLKPDIMVIADDLAAQDGARFEWLLNARDSISQTGPRDFEVVRNGVRLWIQPLLPKGFKSEIQKRKIEASDVRGESDIEGGMLTTLNLQVESVPETRYLVVLCVLADAETPAPEVFFENLKLHISHAGNFWEVEYKDKLESADEPILVVVQPEAGQSVYSFVRKNTEGN